jgi:hypothetical protein
MRRAAIMLALAAACSGDDLPRVMDAPPDPGGPVDLTAAVMKTVNEPLELSIRIDGERAEPAPPYDGQIMRHYADRDALGAVRITFELLDGGEVLDAVTTDPLDAALQCRVAHDAHLVMHQTMCAYRNGELRYASTTVNSCVADGFCRSRCQDGCGAGMKCGASFTSAALRHSRVDCVPAGIVAAGGACGFAAGAGGRYVDDCADGGLCIDGTCRRTCDGGCLETETCTEHPGIHSELNHCI